MSPTAEQIHYSTETFNECRRLVHSGRVRAGIQHLMRRWRAIPEALQTRFLHAEFLTLPADTQAGINDLGCSCGAAKPASPSARRPSDTRCAKTGNRSRGWMPSKPASTPRTENAGTACAGWLPCARWPPSSSPSITLCEARGSCTLPTCGYIHQTRPSLSQRQNDIDERVIMSSHRPSPGAVGIALINSTARLTT